MKYLKWMWWSFDSHFPHCSEVILCGWVLDSHSYRSLSSRSLEGVAILLHISIKIKKNSSKAFLCVFLRNKREQCKSTKKLMRREELPMTHADTVGLALKGSLEHWERYLMLFPVGLGTLDSQQKLYQLLGNDLFRKSILNGKSADWNLGSSGSLTDRPSNYFTSEPMTPWMEWAGWLNHTFKNFMFYFFCKGNSA